jgi:hypothetical protein
MAPPAGLSLEQVTRVTGKKALKGDALATCKVNLLNLHMFDLHHLVFILEFSVDKSA